MDENTLEKVTDSIVDFINCINLIADEENYDRDFLIKATAEILTIITETCTFNNYEEI